MRSLVLELLEQTWYTKGGLGEAVLLSLFSSVNTPFQQAQHDLVHLASILTDLLFHLASSSEYFQQDGALLVYELPVLRKKTVCR